MPKIRENIVLGTAVVCAAVLLFCFPQAVLTGASRGLSLLGNVLIPSLLPFLSLVGICMHSGVNTVLSAVFRTPVRRLFHLPEAAASPILFAFVGGYPAGAVAVKALLDTGKITPKQAARVMHFCVDAGPAFAVSAVGGVMLGSTYTGWVLLAAHLLAAFLIGFAEARKAPLQQDETPVSCPLPLAAAFTKSVNTATETMVAMGGFVVLFSVALSLADGTGLCALLDRYIPGGSVMLAGTLEVTAGCMAAANGATPFLFLIGLFLSFGGVSVHCQVRSILREYPASLTDFFLFRLLHGLLGGVLTVLLFWVFPSAVPTFSSHGAAVQMHTVSPLVSLALLGMCITLMISGKKRLPKGENCGIMS